MSEKHNSMIANRLGLDTDILHYNDENGIKLSKFIENDVYNYITLDASVNSRNSYGGTSAESVMTQVKLAKSFLDDNL